jgi:hypothetical protein
MLTYLGQCWGQTKNWHHRCVHKICCIEIDSKDVETVAKAIFENWFCKFGIPPQLHTDGGKEFVIKLSAELFELLNVQHSKTSPYHPQCNAQVEVFNKTVF